MFHGWAIWDSINIIEEKQKTYIKKIIKRFSIKQALGNSTNIWGKVTLFYTSKSKIDLL